MWQNRIYALIIRRILGPYLTAKSKRNLLKTLDISLRHGRVTLHSLELDGQFITDKLRQSAAGGTTATTSDDDDNDDNSSVNGTNGTNGFCIKSVQVNELNISLFLVYNNDDNDKVDENGNAIGTNENYSGSTGGGGIGARLVAKVELNGVHVEVEIDPSHDNNNGSSESSSAAAAAGAAKSDATALSARGFIQSYVQAALDSLKLSLDINDLNIKISSPSTMEASESESSTASTSTSWITMHLDSISYKDSSLPPPPSTTISRDEDDENDNHNCHGTGGRMYGDENLLLQQQQKQKQKSSSSILESKVVLGKEICLDKLWIEIGTSSTHGNSTTIDTDATYEIIRFNGMATIIATIMSNKIATTNNSSNNDNNPNTKDTIERHLEIALDDKLDINIHPLQLQTIHDMLMKQNQSTYEEDINDKKSKNQNVGAISSEEDIIAEEEEEEDDDDDEQDLGLLSNILKQQRFESSQYMSSPPSHQGAYSTQNNPSASSIDGFFYTNQEGYSHYRNLLASSIIEENDEENVNNSYNQDQNSNLGDSSGAANLVTTSICLYLKEVLVNIQIYSFSESYYERLLQYGDHYDENESICLTIIDLNVVVSKMSQIEISLDMKDFCIEHIVHDESIMNKSEDDGIDEESLHFQKSSIVEFVKDSSVDETSLLEPTNYDHVVALKYRSKQHINKEEADVEIVVASLLITYHQDTVSKITDSYMGLLESNSEVVISSSPNSINKKKNANLKLECKYIAIEVPLFDHIDPQDDQDLSDRLNNLFRRSGYITQTMNSLSGPTLSLIMTDVDMSMSMQSIGPEIREMEISIILQRSLVSMISPIHFDNLNCQRFDLISIDSETQIDPDSTIKVEYSKILLDKKSDMFKKKRAKKYFPVIVPLASVKASQQFDNEDTVEDSQIPKSANNANDTHFAQSLKNIKRSLRGADPQTGMLKEAGLCESNILVSIPSIALDLTTNEKDSLLYVLSRLPSKDENQANREMSVENSDGANAHSSCIGLSFQCNQFSLSLHHDFDWLKEKEKGPMYTQLFVWDGMRTHCLLDKNGLKHVRFVSEDVTLYEAEHIVNVLNEEKNMSLNYSSVREMSDMIRKRRFHNSRRINSSAVFFRSKMSHPLSPKTPALLVDMIIRRQDDDCNDIERSLHVSLYDLTYRHDLESCWVDRLKILVQNTASSAVEQGEEMQQSENITVTNVFCTVSDCNFDYSSPAYFKNVSRTILRVGEVRITSNLVSPSGPVQTYKMSIGNISVHLSNKRNEHKVENSRISCSRLVFDSEQLSNSRKKVMLSHSLDDALFKMDFIAIATLDYLEAAITQSSDNDVQSSRSGGSQRSAPDADTTLTLSVGRVCMYACKDSFECFTETVNELILKLTMPTSAELEIMRNEFFGKKETKFEAPGVASLKREESLPITDTIAINEPPALNEFMNQDLLSNSDIEAVHFVSTLNDEVSKYDDSELSRKSTLSTVLDSNSPPSYQSTIELDVCETENGHAFIQDFYDVNNRDMNHQISHLSHNDSTNCWTAVDHPWSHDPSIPDGEEQCARWYTFDETKNESTIPQLLLPNGATVVVQGDPGRRQPRIFNHHIPLKASSDPLSGGDMGASSYAGTKKISIKLRIIVTDMAFNCRLFDGYDWPASTDMVTETNTNTKSKLLGELMGDLEESHSSPIFGETDSNVSSGMKGKMRKKERQSNRYFQFNFSGLTLRLDSLADSKEHYLSSCMELKFTNMLFIETVSSDKPVKLLAEWINEEEHPRDSNDGLLMMKMVTLHPEILFDTNGKLMGDEGHAIVEFLPIRFYIHQSTIRFIRQFFAKDNPKNNGDDNDEGPPDIFFPIFKVKPFDIKVDYKPLEVDKSALKDGSYIQLLNLLPLEDMILRLNGVELRNQTGWGAVMSELSSQWLQHVSSTQMHKFLTRTTLLHPLANVGDSMKNFVLIPLHEYNKDKGNVRKALRKSTSKLVGVVAYETLSVGAKITGYAAKKLSKRKKKFTPEVRTSRKSSGSHGLQSTLPRNMGDVSDRAIESLSRGLKEANAKIIIMPYREYQKTGTTGAMKMVVKGIPVAVCAPLSGAVEALSQSLYGASNQLRPDLFEEREASKRFHDEDL